MELAQETAVVAGAENVPQRFSRPPLLIPSAFPGASLPPKERDRAKAAFPDGPRSHVHLANSDPAASMRQARARCWGDGGQQGSHGLYARGPNHLVGEMMVKNKSNNNSTQRNKDALPNI